MEIFQEGGKTKNASSLSEFAAKQKQRSVETRQDPKKRNPLKEENLYSENIWTKNDYARLGSVAADLTALIDPEPISAGILGLSSDVTNLVTDLNEGYSVWKSLGNFGGNVALSAVGLIPVVGDAFGSGSKVIKTLAKMTPKLQKTIKVMATAGVLSNGDEILKSVNKLIQPDTWNEITVEDFRNFQVLLSAVIGNVNAGRNRRANIKVKEASTTNDLMLKVRDSKGKLINLKIEDPSVAAKLRGSTSAEQVNTVLRDEGLPYTIDPIYKRAIRPSKRHTVERDPNSKPELIHNYQDLDLVPWSWNRTGPIGTFNIREATPDYIYKKKPEAPETKPTVETRPVAEIPQQKAQSNTDTTTPPQSIPQSNIPKQTSVSEQSNANQLNVLRSSMNKTPEVVPVINPNEFLRTPTMPRYPSNTSLRIKKGQSGMKLNYRYFNNLINTSLQEILNKGIASKSQRNYGTSYTPIQRGYIDYEYGTNKPVDLSGIKNADAGLRSKNLTLKHSNDGFDYSDAQKNTNERRATWQQDSTNRDKDLMSYARTWYNLPENKGKSFDDFLKDYNEGIDYMYNFKHNMSLPQNSGSNAYKTGADVQSFNRLNYNYYNTANAVGGVHGYDTATENINGTSTSARFIDKTQLDIPFRIQFSDSDTEEFKKWFNTEIYKDPAGRIYTVNRPMVQQVYKPTQKSEIERANNSNIPNKKNNNTNSGINSVLARLSDLSPYGLELAKYLATLRTNNESLDNVKKMPILLHNPIERTRWLHGDLNAVQNANNQAGQLNHMASRPLTSDGSLQTSAMLQANKQGNQYKLQGALQDTQAINDSKEKVWTQEGINQQSRYTVAATNKESIHQHDVDQINAKGNYLIANYNSLHNLLINTGRFMKAEIDEKKQIREAYEQASLKNDVLSNLAKYNINATPEEQNMIIALRTGARRSADLTPEELQSYNRISGAVSEKVRELTAKSHGYFYKPFNYNIDTKSYYFKPDIISSEQNK